MRSKPPWVVGLSVGVAGLLAFLALYPFARRPAEVVVPVLTAPIKIGYGASFLDGGSTAVCLVGSDGVKLWLVNPASLDAEEKGVINGSLYIGQFDQVLDGKGGAICPVPSDNATKIAGYLEQAIHEAYPTADVRYSASLPAGLSFEESERLSSVKFLLFRIRVVEAQAYRRAHNLEDVDSKPGWLKEF